MKKLTRIIIDQRRKIKKKIGRPKGTTKPKPPDPAITPPNAGEVGRPTKYTPKLGQQICQAIATTAQGLKRICEDKGFPTSKTVYSWIRQFPEFREMYRQARVDQATVLADDILELADNERLGQMVIQKEDGSRYVRVGDMTGRTKIQISARQWLLARLDPKKWGAKLDVTDSTNPLKALADGWEKRYREITNGESVDATESDGPVAPTAA